MNHLFIVLHRYRVLDHERPIPFQSYFDQYIAQVLFTDNINQVEQRIYLTRMKETQYS